jgi:hypothetical protein
MGRGACAALGSLALAFVLAGQSGCAAQGGPGARSGRIDHAQQLLGLLRSRDFDAIATAIPTPAEFTEEEVATFRREIRHMLRLFSAEFGTFTGGKPVADGTRLYSVSVRAATGYNCRIAVTTYEVEFSKLGPGYLNMVYCDDRPDLKVATVAFGLAQSAPSARERVVAACLAAVVGMGWAFDREVARAGCEQQLPE